MEKKKIIAMLPLVGLLLASSCANQNSVSIIEGDKVLENLLPLFFRIFYKSCSNSNSI